MKKKTLAGILCAVLALLALGVLTVCLTLQNKEATFFPDSSPAQSDAEAVLQELHDAAAQPVSEPEEKKKAAAAKPADRFVVWAGDSRTIGMRDAMEDKDAYIGASGEGYRWLSETGLPQIEDAIRTYPDAPVVFNFGVNDYDSMEDYLLLYRELCEEYPDTHFYFLSVNPIDPAVCKNITNEEIADFNSHLRSEFPDAYIDSYTFLMVSEIVTIDGIHYSEEDYRAIHDYAEQEIARLERRR